MINFRFHVVSVVAVIVAVAAGLILGTVVLRTPATGSARANAEAADDRNQDLQQQIDVLGERLSAGQRLAEELAPTILNGRLANRRVIVVTTPAVADDVTGVEAMLAKGGASVSGRIELTDRFLDPQRRDSLLDLALASLPPGVPEGLPATTDGIAATSALFGAILLRRATAVPESDVRSVLSAYVSQGFLTGQSGVAASADALVVLAGRLSTSDPDSEPTDPDRPEQTVSAFVAGLSGLGPVVVAGAGADPGTVVGRLRADAGTATRVSTVDNLPAPQGKLATAWILADQLAGRVGHYGDGPAATSPLPPLAPPTPPPPAPVVPDPAAATDPVPVG